MDWSVILDGFVLLMACGFAGFLVYGAVLGLEYRFGEGDRPDAAPSEPVRYDYELLERCRLVARRERSAVIGAALTAAAVALLSPQLVRVFATASLVLVAWLGVTYAMS
jgi:hypothetical protein